MVLLRNKHQE